jgi:hypothetical protein
MAVRPGFHSSAHPEQPLSEVEAAYRESVEINLVVPAKAGNPLFQAKIIIRKLGPCLRRDDGYESA